MDALVVVTAWMIVGVVGGWFWSYGRNTGMSRFIAEILVGIVGSLIGGFVYVLICTFPTNFDPISVVAAAEGALLALALIFGA